MIGGQTMDLIYQPKAFQLLVCCFTPFALEKYTDVVLWELPT